MGFVIFYCIGSDCLNFLLCLLAFAKQLTFDVGGAESAYMFTTSVFLGAKSLRCNSPNPFAPAVDLANDDDGALSLKIKQQEINILENNLNISNIDFGQFQQFANGLFQAEGTIGAYFSSKESLRVEFNFSIGQNYSEEAVDFLLKLKAFLGIGRITVEKNILGLIHIRLVTTKTQEILDKVVPYFKYIYGRKRSDLAKLDRINNLYMQIRGSSDKNEKLISELITLVYSINLEGQAKKISLNEKLSLFNCSESSVAVLEKPENTDLPSNLFIIGLFLGDGSLGFVFDERKDRAPTFTIKVLFSFVYQKASESNLYLLTLVAKSLNITPKIYTRSNKMVSLSYSGKFVFDKILPFFNEYPDWLYWRKRHLDTAKSVSEIYKNNRHLTKEGYIEIINILYSASNNYAKPKEYWLNLVEERVTWPKQTYRSHIQITNILTGAVSIYDSLVLASKDLGVSATAVAKVIDTDKKLKKIYDIKYL